MRELFITVSFPGMSETTYRFDKFPVKVGRAASSDLWIGHEAVPRELCLAWVEPDGRTIRVEERPGLKNALLSGNTKVEGGISKPFVSLTIGPCALRFFAQRHVDKSGSKLKMAVAFAVLGAALIFIPIVGARGRDSSILRKVADLPKSPFCAPRRVEECDGSYECAARARLLATRAREMLLRPSLDRRERIRAATMLKSAAAFLDPTAPAAGRRAFDEASAIELELTRLYQQDVMALKLAVERGDLDRARTLGARLLDDLADCGKEQRRALEAFVRGAKGRDL